MAHLLRRSVPLWLAVHHFYLQQAQPSSHEDIQKQDLPQWLHKTKKNTS